MLVKTRRPDRSRRHTRAIEVLSDFDAVLILENLDRGFDQLFHRLGWCRPNNAEWGSSPSGRATRRSASAEDRRKLARLNAHDHGVYNFAREPPRRWFELPPADVGQPYRACRAGSGPLRLQRSPCQRSAT